MKQNVSKPPTNYTKNFAFNILSGVLLFETIKAVLIFVKLLENIIEWNGKLFILESRSIEKRVEILMTNI
jgi:nucleoside permease NupC